MSGVDRLSAPALAWIAAALYLLNIVLGAFAVGFAPTMPGAYPVGVAAHVIVDLANVALALIFYEIFRVVSRRLAMLVVFFTLVATSIEMAFVAAQAAGALRIRGRLRRQLRLLRVLRRDDGVAGNPVWLRAECDRRAAGHGLPVLRGVRVHGHPVPVDGIKAGPWIQLPSLAGELSFALWVLIAGLNLEHWFVARDNANYLALHAHGPSH